MNRSKEGRLLGASVFLSDKLIEPYIKDGSDYLDIKISQAKNGILIKPLTRIKAKETIKQL